jgi:tyrosinase
LPVAPRVELALGGSTTATARYLTWAPTQATLRVTDPDGATTPIRVRLRTKPGAKGRLWFRTAPAAAPTPAMDLDLATDGTPSPFLLSGRFGFPSAADRDTSLQVLLGTTTTALAAIPTMIRIRKDAESLTTAERNRFLSALAQLNNAGLGIFRQYRDSHTQVAVAEAHGRDGFWPWHRAFLLDLERALQTIDASVTLPYWRFDRPSPKLFTPAFIGGSGPTVAVIAPTNPLVAWRTDNQAGIPRTPQFDPATSLATAPGFGPVSLEAVTTGSTSPYTQLRPVFEAEPHGRAHISFEGVISVIASAARDPLFFLLHANVDRLWAKWQWFQDRWDDTLAPTYRYRGAAGQAGSTRIGHNAMDTMWPWNDVTGGIRPPTAPRHPFPSSPAASAPPATPTVGDMIDFQGHADPALRQGFDYDDVPYEA